ncbi:MAG: glycosyltransferase family 2 protein [Acidobacteriota bacterium]
MSADAMPLVSVMMPVRNEARFIRRSLGAVLAQDYPHLEIWVTDGASDDGTREYLEEVAARDSRLHILDNPRRIVPTGLNRAIARARGEIIVRVDGHTVIARDYVRTCVEALDRTGADNVGGRMDAMGFTVTARAVARATSSRFGVGGAAFHYLDRETEVDTVYLGAWRREVFDRIGGFDEELVRDQDDELNYRLRAHGGRILLVPTIRSRYVNRASLAKLWRQYRQYGLWKVRVLQKHPRQMRPRQFVPALFVAALAGTTIAGRWSPTMRRLSQLTIGSYVMANGAATVLAGREAPINEKARLPAAFAAMHLGYGVGFLQGLLRFVGRWKDRQGRVPRFDVSNSNKLTSSSKPTSNR